MQPTLEQWKKTQNLGEGRRFSAGSGPDPYIKQMENVVLSEPRERLR